MANLRANKITSTEVFETTGSVQFDGNGDYLTISNSNTDFAFATGDFTIEGWFYRNASSTYHILIDFRRDTSSDVAPLIYLVNGVPYLYTVGGDRITGSSAVSNTSWFHLALCRSGTNTKLFINGVQSGSTYSDSNNYIGKTDRPIIGAEGVTVGNNPFNGYISNLRVLKGTALYTKNFTPPTRELTVIPNTVLFACTSTTNTAQEATGKTITVNGNAVANELTPGLLTDRVKSGGTSAITGSVEFDGNDYLLESTGADGFNGGLGDWTVEAWMYCTDASQSDVLINGLTSSTDRFYINFIGQTLYVGDFNINNIAIGGVKQINSWFHIAVTKSGSTYRAFINGVLIGSSTESLLNSTLTSLQIGYRGSQNYYTKGFISNLRIVKGTAVYTGSFIPPSRELKKLPGTVLLCCKNTSDPTAEETGKTITVSGNATARNFSPQVGFDGTVTFDGVTKINTPNYFYLPTGNTEDRGRGRGLFGGGDPGATNNISFIQIQSQGIAQDFGDLTQGRLGAGGFSSSSRGVFSSGYNAPLTNVNTIDYITISTTSNAVDFGDSTEARHEPGACSSSTRGVVGGGTNPGNSNVMDYVTTASLGNAQDFGDLTVARRNITSAQSPTRGIFFGGRVDPAGTAQNIIDYITIATTGNALDFGDLTTTRARAESVSNATRAVCIGGENPSAVTTMEYVTMSSTGNSVNFGTCSSGANNANNGASNSVRGVFHSASGNGNTLDYITIAATGNTTDFGDLNYGQTRTTAFSDSHGGIEG